MTTTTETHSVTALYYSVVSKHAPTAKAPPPTVIKINRLHPASSADFVFSLQASRLHTQYGGKSSRILHWKNIDLLHTNFKSVIKTRPEIQLAHVQFTSDVLGTKCNGISCRSPRFRNSKLFFPSSQMVKRPGLLR